MEMNLWISWLQLVSAVIFGAQENKICHCFHCLPIYLPWSDVTRCHDFSFLNVEFFFPFIFISWRLITLQYCSGFCHTLTWISHGFTCILHPNPPSHLPLHLIPLGEGEGGMFWENSIECWVLSQLFHSPLSLSLRGSSVLLCFLP